MSEKHVSVTLTQQHDYRFDIRFDDNMPVLTSDEPAPLGTGLGPSPVQLLCAAVGNCLSDSLLFALRKFKQAPEPLRCEVQAEVGRNTDGRMRVLNMLATLHLGVPVASLTACSASLKGFAPSPKAWGRAFPFRCGCSMPMGSCSRPEGIWTFQWRVLSGKVAPVF
jgi:uncharacterized OsmC-like protein